MYDRVDEWVVSLTEFEGKPLQSVARGDLELGKLGPRGEQKTPEAQEDEYKELPEVSGPCSETGPAMCG